MSNTVEQALRAAEEALEAAWVEVRRAGVGLPEGGHPNGYRDVVEAIEGIAAGIDEVIASVTFLIKKVTG